MHIEVDQQRPFLIVSLFEEIAVFLPKRRSAIMIFDGEPVSLRPIFLSTYPNLIDLHGMTHMRYRHGQPFGATRCLNPIPVGETLMLELNVVFNYENIASAHFLKETQPWQVIRLVTGKDQLSRPVRL